MQFRHVLGMSLALLTAGAAGAQAVKPIHPAATSDMAEIKPEAVGFSSERLVKLDGTMKSLVDGKKLAGMVTVLARHGKIVEERTYGYADVASQKPMQKDTIVRIYSMTKPITGIAMMMLYEEGKWKPSDPIARYIPEFRDLKVYSGVDKDGKPTLDKPGHAPTMGELMSHTAGFTYGVFGATPVDKMYQEAQLLSAPNLQDFIERVAKLPLLYQPGEGWVYSVSVDIQGYLVEKLSGKSFPDFLRERIFLPLGMKDTGFYVPAEKLDRVATIYQGDAAAATAMPKDPGISQPPGLPSGGGGLYSTAGDYLRFAQMVLNGGELNGVRLVAPSSIELMRTNHVSDEVKNARKFGIGFYQMQPGLGFGYDFAILEDPSRLGSTAGKGSFLWDGVAGTWFWIDPANDVVFVGIVQRWLLAPGTPDVENLSRALTYQALVNPNK
ncbi:MAG TPA: serine hydrolase domain-containing protein [Steroidobacteraceae bacterium]|jgi:CubicO group peptidase (beta-lactamase class C family)|nr:serine hydrolase domain-containing protein [Steroidobacteraceae bacterium]